MFKQLCLPNPYERVDILPLLRTNILRPREVFKPNPPEELEGKQIKTGKQGILMRVGEQASKPCAQCRC